MSYIQIELGGKLRALKFNMYALEEYTKRVGVALQKSIDKKEATISQATLVYACVFSGLIGNYFAKEMDIDFTFEDVTDWVDAASNKDLEAACNCLSETERYKEKIKAIDEATTDKKKATKKSGLKSTN